MRIKHYARGKFYQIDCPEGSRVVRHAEGQAPRDAATPDRLVVPFHGREISIPAEPEELLPLLAESGRCGLAMVGKPQPDARLEGASCPYCGEDDAQWLSLEEEGESIHCDYCGSDIGHAMPHADRPPPP